MTQSVFIHERRRWAAAALTFASSALLAIVAFGGCGSGTSVPGNLVLLVNVTGGGTIVSNPTGVFCRGAEMNEGAGGSCSNAFAESVDRVELVARPAPGWRFDGWTARAGKESLAGDESRQSVQFARKTAGALEQTWGATFVQVPSDGSMDAGVDAGRDAGVDAGEDVVDAGGEPDAGQPVLSLEIVTTGITTDLLTLSSENGDAGYIFAGGVGGRVLSFHDPADVFKTFTGAGGTTNHISVAGFNLISATGNKIYESLNGATFTLRATLTDIQDVLSLYFANGTYVLLGAQADGLGIIYTSADGRTWVERRRAPSPGLAMQDITWDGTAFISVGSAGVVQTAPEGINWVREKQDITAELLHTVAASPSLALGLGGPGGSHVVIASTDHGVTWTQRPNFPAGVTVSQLAWTGRVFVAVGAGGRVFTSADGTAWTEEQSPTTAHLADVVANGPWVVAAGAGGVVLWSPLP